MRSIWFFFLTPFILMSALYAEKSKQDLPNVLITPPKGWECIQEASQLPQKVKFIYIGTGKKSFSPSINLACEETTLQLDGYVETAKAYHESQSETRCAILGNLETKAGVAKVMQIERPTQWGMVRFLQAIVIRGSDAYVITATCLKEEFPSLSPQFFKAIQSFTIEK